MRKQRSWGWIFAAFTALALSGCGGGDQSFNDDGGGDGGGGNTGGTPATLSVATAQAAIVADGQSTALITATLLDTTGAPVAGRAVSFETSAGTLQAATATTSNTGQASVRLQAPQVIGRAVVTAREATSGLSAVTEVGFISAAPASVAIQAAPSTIRPGAATSITVSVSDANGNPVGGELVRLDTVRNDSGGQFLSTQVTTDSNGRGTTSYTAGRGAGIDTLRVQTAGGRAATAGVTVSAAAALVGEIALELGSSELVGDGRSTTTVRATVTDTTGEPLAGLSVSFTATAGSLSAASAVTNADGITQVTLTAPTRVGNATVSASTGGFQDSRPLTFVAGPVSQILLAVAPGSVVPGGTASARAIALDANGNRVPGEVVTFSSTVGAAISPVSVSTDDNGEALSQYRAVSTPGTDTVRAQAANGIAGVSRVTVDSDNARVTGIQVVAGASNVEVGGEPVALRATVSTDAGPVNGISVLFSSTAGSLSATQALTDADGIAEVLLAPGDLAATAEVTVS
ncbi:MAG TPA: Ig-like domain-containing protein, partial [Nevskiaceae bacterium]|nr:Ig-like domain-containing protein [Nevskiaceae bacterium]